MALIFRYFFLEQRKEIKKRIIIIAETLLEILIKKENRNNDKLDKEMVFKKIIDFPKG